MLRFLKVTNPEQVKNILKAYEPLKDTWIVSDLRSKQEVQNESIKRNGYFTDDAILRVSDFWRLWLRRLEPTLSVVSSDFIRSMVQSFVDIYAEQLEILESETSTLNKALQEFAPIILHPASDEVLAEWLKQQSDAGKDKKWQRWYLLSKACVAYIVKSKNAIDGKWSAAYLQSLDLSFLKWPRKIYVDLGSELTGVEMGLFKVLSQHVDVCIVMPAPVWDYRYPQLLSVYNENSGYGRLEAAASEVTDMNLSQEQFVRLSTQLAEVKYAVSLCRKWADEGIDLNQIAVVAGDIEIYWPVLRFYLEEEGLTYKKDVVGSLNSLGDVQILLAAIKSYSQEVSWDSLEKTFFSSREQTDYNFEKFKALFYQLYDQDDLSREKSVKELFFKKIDFNADIEREEFLSFLVKTWMTLPQSDTQSDLFEIIFKDILAQSLNIKMKLSRWVLFFKNRLSRKEVTLKRSSSSGLNVLSLMSAQLIEADHRIYLGLNDEYYSKRRNKIMPASDALLLKSQFDLSIDSSEESYLDFNLRWQALATPKNSVFTTAHLSFNSDPINAALFFLEYCPQSEIQAPLPTRVDELQLQYAHPELMADGLKLQLAQTVSFSRLEEDKKGYSATIKSDAFESLSVSDIENYSKCSFKLLAGRGFKLGSYSQVAIDLDPRDKGTIIHALFEHIIDALTEHTYSLQSTADFLDSQRTERHLYSGLDTLWAVQKNKFLSLAQKFVQFESERLKVFSTETEKECRLFFDLEKSEFTLEKTTKCIAFNVRIDRIDTHKKNKYGIIYDYKSSSYGISKRKNWLNEYQFQMLMYIMALKLSLPEEASVKGALYYFYKNFDIKTGLIDKGVASADFGFNNRNTSLIEADEWVETENQFRVLISEVLNRLHAGEFAASPKKTVYCDECDWRKLCRAPHLM